MKSMKTIRIATLIVIAVSTGLLFTQCSSSPEADSKASKKAGVTERSFPVKVMTIESQSISRTIDYTANLNPWKEVHLASAQPGQIKKTYVEVGDKVRAGDKIVDMDPTQLNAARIQLADAKVNLDRLDTLIRVGGISQQQYDQVKVQYDVASANIKFLEDNTAIVAPVTGIVTGKYYENMELFSAAPNTQAGKAAIVTIQQINKLKAFVGVSEQFFPLVYEGMPASVTCDIYPEEEFQGKVSLIHPTINAMTRTFMVEVTVPNTKEILRPGMFARVNFALGEEEAIVLPSIAVMQQEGTNERFIFVNRDNVARRISVTLGKRFDDQMEVISNDLKIGDQLIVAGQKNLLDGYKVDVIAQ